MVKVVYVNVCQKKSLVFSFLTLSENVLKKMSKPLSKRTIEGRRWRIQARHKRRLNIIISKYVEENHKNIYEHCTEFYNAVVDKYPTVQNLAKTQEFSEWMESNTETRHETQTENNNDGETNNNNAGTNNNNAETNNNDAETNNNNVGTSNNNAETNNNDAETSNNNGGTNNNNTETNNNNAETSKHVVNNNNIKISERISTSIRTWTHSLMTL